MSLVPWWFFASFSGLIPGQASALLQAQPHQVKAVALLVLHVLEAVLAEPKLGLLPIVFWER